MKTEDIHTATSNNYAAPDLDSDLTSWLDLVLWLYWGLRTKCLGTHYIGRLALGNIHWLAPHYPKYTTTHQRRMVDIHAVTCNNCPYSDLDADSDLDVDSELRLDLDSDLDFELTDLVTVVDLCMQTLPTCHPWPL
eukprot:TRINITY_DN33039_c0_g1_i1.p2 TRINITY_DN33039_c0_g1~~TRINITY_DN33039_c0_g1_i1.p2  ORF type:complete len:136 (+),score=12.63 TRINITY_DN33039_c0_g1_i1:238-645(+)